MATTSEVKAGLDAISQLISGAQQSRQRAKSQMLAARNQLAGIPSQFSDVISEIDSWTVPVGAFQSLGKDEKAKLQTEFLTLKSALEDELDALGVSYS